MGRRGRVPETGAAPVPLWKTYQEISLGNKTNVGPRFGFSYQAASKLVVRGTYGIYFDAPNFNGFFDNRPGNGGAVGVQANPTGATPVQNVSPTHEWLDVWPQHDDAQQWGCPGNWAG